MRQNSGDSIDDRRIIGRKRAEVGAGWRIREWGSGWMSGDKGGVDAAIELLRGGEIKREMRSASRRVARMRKRS